MGFLAKISSSFRGLFGQRSPRSDKGTFAPARKRGTKVNQDTPVGDWKDDIDAAGFQRHGHGGDGWDLRSVQLAEWVNVISSNVERIRYGEDDRALQVIFKNGSLYQYEDVEPEIYAGFLHTHSPGQYVWYVLRAYGYAYSRLAGGEATTAPAAPRYDEQVFGVPKWIEDIQAKAGRSAGPEGIGMAAPPGHPGTGKAKSVPFNENVPPLPWK